MKAWYAEPWHFEIEVLRVGQRNDPRSCRLGLEPGDRFECDYATPAGFCPTAFIKIFPAMEALRCGGDLRELGAQSADATTFLCPDGVVTFRLQGHQRATEA
jgi:uncharacterized repeat protein (TIGR04076 family)